MLRTNVSFAYSPKYAFIFPFEENFNKDAWRDWMADNWQLAVYLGMVYVVGIFGGRHLMEKRPRYELRYALAAWNFGLAAFSLMGTLRTTPEFLHVLSNYGFHFSVCNRSYADYNPISGFWGCMFVLSKIPEYIDTVFIVLRKQKLIFLHYYHHLATAIFLWYGYTDHSSTARWIFVMNYSVHFVMYTYYGFRSLKYRIPKWVSMFITMFQISQMIAGSVVFGYVFYVTVNNIQCDIQKKLANISMAIYVSYFVLFTNFFIQAYLKRNDDKHLKSKALNGHAQTNGKKID